MARAPKQNPGTRTDDRVRRDTAPTARGDRGIEEDAARANETGLVHDVSELERMLASEFDQVALPTPPHIPGWHTCWLTTGSQYDTVQKRQRLGYVPVKQADVPGFEAGGMTSAQFEGAITCNEMVLFKITEDRYQAIMRMFHHSKPLAEEQSIYEKVVNEQQEDSTGRPLGKLEGDGFTQLGQNIERAKRGVPVF
jgi:hypothetical protein